MHTQHLAVSCIKFSGASLFSVGNLWQMPPVTGSYPQMKKKFTDAPQRLLSSFESVKSADKTLRKRLAVRFIHQGFRQQSADVSGLKD